MRSTFDLLTRSAGVMGTVLLLVVVPGQAALAHEFVVALRAVGAERETILTDAVRGFLLATAERDAHADETSNGHLGGLDVYIIPFPNSVADRFPELKAAPTDRPDIVVVIGPPEDSTAELEKAGRDIVSIRPGLLDCANRWGAVEAQEPDSFAARYSSAYEQLASRWAAEGYNAARRIDDAIRPLDGVSDRAALESAFEASADGIRWRDEEP
jgi:hypothetical protein